MLQKRVQRKSIVISPNYSKWFKWIKLLILKVTNLRKVKSNVSKSKIIV